MIINRFEDESGSFYVLRNDEEQHSIWPTAIAVPEGWQVVFGQDSRASCVEYVEQSWLDMRPKSLRDKV